MSAVYNQTFTIDPSVDLTNVNSEQCWNLLDDAWSTEFEQARIAQKQSFADLGKTVFGEHYTVLNKGARTYSTSRQFTDLQSATEYKTWMDSNIPSDLGNFTRISSTATDNQSLSSTGWATI